MTACPACADFAQNPRTGSTRAQCLECRARSIADSPIYDNAAKANAITAPYKAALERAFGGDWLVWHERVKHYAALLKGST
ncbi:MAG: hypothetical protein KGL39_42715 [Patescibacteria group bacterium]|nr:hypothetical protein [Patescibacteria group bacterium]